MKWFCVPLLLLSACLSTSVVAADCPGISDGTTQRLLNRLKNVAVADGYRFDGIATHTSRMAVLWSFGGTACPPIRVDVENCAAPSGLAALRLRVPADLATRCPGLQPVVDELARAVPAEHPVGQAFNVPAAAWPLLIGIVALVVVAGVVIRHLVLRAAGRTLAWGDIGWTASSLAVAVPFFLNARLAVTVELGAAWIVFALLLVDRGPAAGVIFMVRSRWSLWASKSERPLAGESRGWKLSILGLFAFSLLLRWALSSGGPGDLHLNLSAIWSSGLEGRWGMAPIAFFRLLGTLLGGVRDTHIVWCNLILSSLLPILLYGIVVDIGVGKVAALLAAAVAALHPLLIALSGVLGRQPLYMFAAYGSVFALTGFLKRGGGRRFLAFVLGAVLATTTRPEGAHVLVLYIAVLLVMPASRRVRVAVTIALVLLSALAFAYVRTAVEPKLPDSGVTHVGLAPILWTIVLDGSFTPAAWIGAWVLGLVLGVRRRAAWVALLAVVGLDIVWRWAGIYRMFVGHERQVASARYETILVVPFVIGIALFVEAVTETRPWLKRSLAVAFVALTVMTIERPYTTLIRPFTVDYEYRFLKKHALALPPHARIYVLNSLVDDIGFMDAHFVGQFTGSAVTFLAWTDRNCRDLVADPSQTYLYIGSSCADLVVSPHRPLPSPDYARWMQDCTAIRERVRDDRVEEVDVPAHKMSWNDFKDNTVRLGLYRLKDASMCALGPGSGSGPARSGG